MQKIPHALLVLMLLAMSLPGSRTALAATHVLYYPENFHDTTEYTGGYWSLFVEGYDRIVASIRPGDTMSLGPGPERQFKVEKILLEGALVVYAVGGGKTVSLPRTSDHQFPSYRISDEAEWAPIIEEKRRHEEATARRAAEGYQLTTGTSGGLEITGPDCASVAGQLEHLRQWQSRAGEPAAASPVPSQLKVSANGRCTAQATRYLPEFLRNRYGFAPQPMGPNCWDSALIMNQIVPGVRFVTGDEVTFWLSSPLCHELGASDKALPGDIIAIRASGPERSDVELHAFIHLSDELVFSKNGATKDSSYQIQMADDVYDLYGLGDECRANRSIRGKLPAPASGSRKCLAYSNRYRCMPLQQYIDARPKLRGNANLTRASRELTGTECAISAMVMGTAPINSAWLSSVDHYLNAVTAYVDESEKKLKLEPDVNFVLNSLKQRALSLSEQIRFLFQWHNS